jgi:hypothetical protein
MAQSDRDIIFANESFLIGMLQAVSGGSLVAALSQAEALIKHGGRFALVFLLTAMALALVVAVLAAYWKHHYKMWDVKAQVSASQGNAAEATARNNTSGKYLTAMRRGMFWSVLLVAAGLVGLIVAVWVRAASG